jgi:hypothetical protein
MEPAIYILCTATALASALLLLRGYRRTRVRLLLWTGIFFLLLTLENALLFVDRILIPTAADLTFWRAPVALVAILVLLFGLIWEKR